MEIETLLTIGGYLLTPVTGVVSWFAAKRVRNNETLNKLQSTIDSLVEKNCELIGQMTELRAENSQLKTELLAVRNENAELKRGQDELKKQLSFIKQFGKVSSPRSTRKASIDKAKKQ